MKRYKTNHVLFSKGVFTESEVMRFYNNLINKNQHTTFSSWMGEMLNTKIFMEIYGGVQE